MHGFITICEHLIKNSGFTYVILRETQSDRIEGELYVYRQITGVNAFMTAGDVMQDCKNCLAR